MIKCNTVLLGVIAVVILVLNTHGLKSQCPPGWTTTTRTYQYSGACSVTVSLCYKCGLTGANPANIRLNGWTQNASPDCPSPLDIPDSWFINKFSNEYLNICSTPPPPCGQGCVDFIIELPACRQWYYNQSPTPPPPPFRPFYAWNQACLNNEKWCQTILRLCYDLVEKKVVECLPRNPTTTYGPDCTLSTPIPAPTYPQATPGFEIPYGDCYDNGCQ